MARSSVLERLSAPLCDAVLERSDSASMLAEIERSNFFLVPLDATGSEYRYHHLFAAVFRRQLETDDPEAVPGLHARASLWFEDHGEIERAIDHAIASGDLARASTLVLREGGPVAIRRSNGDAQPLVRRRSPGRRPRPTVSSRSCARLSARLSGQGRDEVERWLRVAEDGPDYGPLANGIASIRSAVAMVSSTYLSRGIADAERSARFVLENEPAGSEWRYAGLVPLGQALFLAGRGGGGARTARGGPDAPGARHRATSILALAYLSLIELAAGDVERAEQLAREALALAEEIGHIASAGGANAASRPRMCADERRRSPCGNRAPRTRGGARRRSRRIVVLARSCQHPSRGGAPPAGRLECREGRTLACSRGAG